MLSPAQVNYFPAASDITRMSLWIKYWISKQITKYHTAFQSCAKYIRFRHDLILDWFYSIYLVHQMLSSAWRCPKKPAWQFLLSTWRTLLVVLAWSALPENLFPTFPLCQTTKSKNPCSWWSGIFWARFVYSTFFWTSGIGKFKFWRVLSSSHLEDYLNSSIQGVDYLKW